MNINFNAPVIINMIAFVAPAREAAPVQVIDQPTAPAQIAAPDDARLYAPDVEAESDRRFGPRPYRLTLDMRRQIAAELDAER